MQYTLTEEEFEDLVHKSELEKALAALEVARDEILNRAGYTCIHQRNDIHFNYCYGCPCNPLEHSKNGNRASYHIWKLICGRTPAYGK
jgi:hypothetical protein